MKRFAFAAAAVALFALPAEAQTPFFGDFGAGAPVAAGYGNNGYGNNGYGNAGPFGSQLSSCMRNGLIGAGVGAVLGGVASKNSRMGGAAIGAILGGAGTYFVCKYLGNRDQARIERGYMGALDGDSAYASRFSNEDLGGLSLLNVGAPQPVQGMDNCRDLNATLTTPGYGQLPLPQERYCRAGNGQWAPAPF